MDAENYVIQYPLDAVHVDKFADLLGKPKTAVSEMVKANKLPIIELRDPCKPKARAGEKWVFIPEFNRAVLSITVESSPVVILRYQLPHLLSTPQQCLIWLMTVSSNGMTRRS